MKYAECLWPPEATKGRALPKAAIVSVRLYIRGAYEGVPFEGHIRYTRFWMLRERRWQVVGGHSSVVA